MASLGPFLVPQFIDVESKIIGRITTRQFLLLMVAGMIDFIIYKLFYFNTFLIIAVPITGVFLIFAFIKINGMPFHLFFLNLVQTMKKPKIRIWYKEEVKALPNEEKKEVEKEFIPKPAIPESRLTKLSLIVNTGGAYKPEQ